MCLAGAALMCQLYLYVEGQTEQVFATNVLAPYLAHYGVYLMGPVLAEISRRKRGGVLSYEPFRNGLRSLLKQHHRPGVWFSSMIDLYSLPKNFPEWEKAAERRHDPNARVTHLEEALASDIGDRRFIPYIQLHEFEALLFAGQPVSLSITPTNRKPWNLSRRSLPPTRRRNGSTTAQRLPHRNGSLPRSRLTKGRRELLAPKWRN